MSGKIYLFGEASIEAIKTQITSPNPKEQEKAIDDSVLKITMLRSLVDEKRVKKIFVEEGSVLVRAIFLNFPDTNAEVLHWDPRIQRTIRATRQQIEDSILLNERLKSEFEGIDEEPVRSNESTASSADRERYARVLEERMKGLTPAEELSRKLDEARAKIEAALVEQINDGFVDPSLVVCGRIHLSPSKEETTTPRKSGRIPELLREKGYDVEVLFVEPEEQQT